MDDERLTLRAQALDTAKEAITKSRNATYGEPHQDFARSAAMVTAMLVDKLKPDETITAANIAQIITCVKLSRLQWSPTHEDSWVDIAGYAGCGYEAAVLTEQEE